MITNKKSLIMSIYYLLTIPDTLFINISNKFVFDSLSYLHVFIIMSPSTGTLYIVYINVILEKEGA